MGAEASSIILLDKEKSEMFFLVADNTEDDTERRLLDVRFPVNKGVAGWVLQSGEAALIHRVGADPRFYPRVDEKIGFTTHSLVCAPLKTPKETIGVMMVLNKVEGEFTEEDLDLGQALSDPIAIAIENARLYEALKEAQSCLLAENLYLSTYLGGSSGDQGEDIAVDGSGNAHVTQPLCEHHRTQVRDVPSARLAGPDQAVHWQETGRRHPASCPFWVP